MLAGAWKGDSEADRQVLSALAHTSYEDLTAALTRWCNEADAPVRHVGDAWYLVSLEDAWSLLSGYLAEFGLNAFRDAAVGVLSEIDPR